jgi:hypothetical protein
MVAMRKSVPDWLGELASLHGVVWLFKEVRDLVINSVLSLNHVKADQLTPLVPTRASWVPVYWVMDIL